jgi:hypothetical protein
VFLVKLLLVPQGVLLPLKMVAALSINLTYDITL